MTSLKELHTIAFYNTLAKNYMKVEANWDDWVRYNQSNLKSLLSHFCPLATDVLDCAAGVGSQALALEKLGLNVTATDISEASLLELSKLSNMPTYAISWNELPTHFQSTKFDAVFCLDNAIGHTEDKDMLKAAISCMASLLSAKATSCVFISTRDFDLMNTEAIKPSGFPPLATKSDMYYQAWDWTSPSTYVATWYIHGEKQASANMRCIYRAELEDIAMELGLGFCECDAVYTQPIYRFYRANKCQTN